MHVATVGMSGKTSSIIKEFLYRLPFLQLITHWTNNRSLNGYNIIVCIDSQKVVVLQTKVLVEFALENEVVEVESRNFLSITIQIDVTDRTRLTYASRHKDG